MRRPPFDLLPPVQYLLAPPLIDIHRLQVLERFMVPFVIVPRGSLWDSDSVTHPGLLEVPPLTCRVFS